MVTLTSSSGTASEPSFAIVTSTAIASPARSPTPPVPAAVTAVIEGTLIAMLGAGEAVAPTAVSSATGTGKRVGDRSGEADPDAVTGG
jgi:hypothetical protein